MSSENWQELIKFDRKGSPYIRRERIFKSKPELPRPSVINRITQFFSSMGGIGFIFYAVFICVVIGLFLWFISFGLLISIVGILPISLMWRFAFKLRPRPPASRAFLMLVTILMIFPGVIGLFGMFVLNIHLYADVYAAIFHRASLSSQFQHLDLTDGIFEEIFSQLKWLPSWLISVAHDQPVFLLACIIPSYIAASIYPIILFICDAFTLEAYRHYCLDAEKAEMERLDFAMAQEERRLSYERDIARSGRVIILGEVKQRYWDETLPGWRIERNEPLQRRLAFLTIEQLVYHLMVLAPTRSGKTYNVIKPIVRFAAQNEVGCLVIDPKGDEHSPEQFHLNFSLRESEIMTSFRLCLIDNSIKDITTATNNVAEALIVNEYDSTALTDYYLNNARLALSAILRGHKIVFGLYPELAEILDYAVSPKLIEKIMDKLTELMGELPQDSLKYIQIEEALRDLLDVRQKVGMKGADPLGTMTQAIRPLASGKYRSLLTMNSEFGYTVREILGMRVPARFALPGLERTQSQAIGRVLIRQYVTVGLDPEENHTDPRLLIVDEAHLFMCAALVTGVTMTAGNNHGIVTAFQNLKEIKDENLARSFFASSLNKIALKGIEASDSKLFSDLFGWCELPYLTHTRGAGSSQGRASSDTYNDQVGSTSSGYTQSAGKGWNESVSELSSQNEGISRNFVHSRVWEAEDIARIPLFNALVVLNNGTTNEPTYSVIEFLSPEKRRDYQLSFTVNSIQLAPLKLAAYAPQIPLPKTSTPSSDTTSKVVSKVPGSVTVNTLSKVTDEENNRLKRRPTTIKPKLAGKNLVTPVPTLNQPSPIDNRTNVTDPEGSKNEDTSLKLEDDKNSKFNSKLVPEITSSIVDQEPGEEGDDTFL